MSEPQNHSVTRWIAGLKAGDNEAEQRLFERYWKSLVVAAGVRLRSHIGHLRDEEDLALSALKSLYSGAAAGRFANLTNRDELWGLLLTITQRKVIDQGRLERRKKRGGGRVVLESDVAGVRDEDVGFILDSLLAQQPMPEFFVSLEEEHVRLLTLLRNDDLRQIAIWRMEGYTVVEIAAKMNVYTRAIERKLQLIRQTWTNEL